MNDLFATSIPAETVLSGRFRVHPVIGDSMEPSLRGGRDYVLTVPVTTYQGEGLYLVNAGQGIELFRVGATLGMGSLLRLSRENDRYGSHCLSRDKFNDLVVGIVVADIRSRDERFLKG